MSTATATPPGEQSSTTADPFLSATHQLSRMTPNQLSVDYQVQRPPDTSRIADVAATFQIQALGVIHVSRRKDGSRNIVDGQTRVAAARIAGYGDDPLDVVLWDGLSLAGEAKLFRLLNNTRRVQPIHKFRIRIVEGDPLAVELNNVLTQYNWQIRKSMAPGSFYAVTALEDVYGDDRDVKTCETVVRIPTNAWGLDSNGMRAEIIKGLGLLIPEYPGLEEAKLTNELAKLQGGPLALVGKAKQLREIRSCRIADAMAEVLVNLHNKGRKIRLPEWRER